MTNIKRFIVAAIAAFAFIAVAQQKPQAYMVSNAHFDSQWNWDVKTSIREYIPKTLRTNLMLLKKYPNYVFNFEGGIKYQWMKEYYPNEYSLIKPFVRNGRWHIAGASWDATDPNIPSPESFIRNIMYGQHFYRNEFGVLSTDIFLPDCFGFGWTLPTIANHCGLIGFSTQKLQWRTHPFYGNSKIPFEIGLWQGVDGKRIMLVADAHNYTSRFKEGEDLSNSKSLLKSIENTGIGAVYHYYGTGDTGGSPTLESVRAVQRGVNANGAINIISATSDSLFRAYLPFDKHPELKVFDGELLMDVHGTGCYTSQAAMKWFNRRNEQLAMAAEGAAATASWLGAFAYPTEELAEAWKRFIWHQFHDDLTGTSIPQTYEFSWNDELLSMSLFANTLSTAVGGVSRALDTQVSGTPLVLFNPSAFAVSDIVELTIDAPKPIRQATVTDHNGKRVAAQVLDCEGGKARVLVAAKLPALGYAVYNLRTSSGKATDVKKPANAIENSVYSLTLDENGDICSIIDKRTNRQLVANGKAFRLALFTPNMSNSWPAWEIMRSTMEVEGKPLGKAEITLCEDGACRKTLKVTRTFGAADSHITQYISLNEGALADRIDIRTELDWKETNSLLKAEFPMSVANAKATYDLGIGVVQRGNNTDQAYEVPAQQWADLTMPDGSYGVAVMNNGKYGWDKPSDNTLRLTLMHTPGSKQVAHYQSRQDQGVHHFTYSIVAHQGDYTAARIVEKAEVLNQGVKAFVAPKHHGALGRCYSFASGSNDNVLLKSLKKAEDGSGCFVLRFVETSGKATQQQVFTFPAEVISADEVNGIEDRIGTVAHNGKSISFDITPFGIRTFKVKLASPAVALTAPAQAQLPLPYTHRATTYNAFTREGNFDGRGNSFAAELWKEQVSHRGINFTLAAADTLNAVKCAGQTINIPAGYANAYLLAASTNRDASGLITFADGKSNQLAEQTVAVPCYSGFFGQWGQHNFSKAFIRDADVAYVGTHRHNVINGDLFYDFSYIYMIKLAIPAGATAIKLPENSGIAVFAITLANDANNTLSEACDVMKAYLPVKTIDEGAALRKNLLLNRPCIEKSGEVNGRECAPLAVDGMSDTKWCDNATDQRTKFVAFDLGATTRLKGWCVTHATLENTNYTTKEFCLQVKTNEADQWRTVDSVNDNTEMQTDRLLAEPVDARYVRLYITKPDQSEGFAARIYEFEVY